ncbi:CPS_HP_G0144480.mRNA.1.CDS.1 [Saccharomyces cerevisiae]|nr:CPS_HP_G0027910.mRNA.1.CDS.1 [Saccharomyces cerevisiae]CAI5154432.1 CPS_HP_G0144480.mRNA.1.CDS.1 [Saccharomyces cerevisiae]CAI6505892.1 CPS_HP_G0027910.mRNA.1.CDS.1 [Saccharomyces cerevisiae]CAI6992449.1 CPS_HP_G0144480.mRNA.1.CDS.1 [Saccharomyces cerevisiae]CAI7451961.1 CPS_collapsed_G0034250.mRNA.1.CDS.1 [Saccharomyces cerevisiae]
MFWKKDPTVSWERKNINGIDFSRFNVAIIGGTGGLGRAISRELAERNARVTVVGQTFRDEDLKDKINFVKADLSLVSECKRISHSDEIPYEELTHLIFTTGIFASRQRQATSEGLEKDMAVSYLSRYIIFHDVAKRLGISRTKKDDLPKVFIAGFPGNGQVGDPDDLNSDEKKYSAYATHMNTVAANESLVIDAKDRYTNIDTFGLNPGLIKTNIRNNLLGSDTYLSRITEWIISWTCQSAETYAKTICTLIASPAIESRSGTMFSNKGDAILPSPGLTKDVVEKFMENSELLVEKALRNQSPFTSSNE